MFCAVSLRKVYWLFFFEDNTISGQTYFEMPQQWLFLRINEDFESFIFQRNGTSPYWHRYVRSFLNNTFPQRWIGCTEPQDLVYTCGSQDHQTLHLATFSFLMD